MAPFERGRDGKLKSGNLYIWWYGKQHGRQCRKTTGTNDVRLACDRLDEYYLSTFRPTARDQSIYDVSMALLDYYLEHGAKQASAVAIKARLKHMQRFIDREVKAGRLSDPVLPDMIDNNFLTRFREWLLAEPIVARKKNDQGEWVAGKSRPRSPATVEGSIIQLKAALNHACQNRRILYVPPIKHKTRPEMSATRTDRITVAQMAEMLDYTQSGAGNYAGHAARLLPLWYE